MAAYSVRGWKNFVLCGLRDRNVYVWSLATGEPVKTLKHHGGMAVRGIAMDDSGVVAAAFGAGPTLSLRVWD